MGSDPIRIAGDAIDLGGRIGASVTVAASPAAAAETIIAALNLPAHLRASESARLTGWAAFTLGANATSAQLRIRRTNVGGAIVGDTGALTGGIAPAALTEVSVEGIDGAGVDLYVLTLEVAGGTTPSAVSALVFACEIF